MFSVYMISLSFILHIFHAWFIFVMKDKMNDNKDSFVVTSVYTSACRISCTILTYTEDILHKILKIMHYKSDTHPTRTLLGFISSVVGSLYRALLYTPWYMSWYTAINPAWHIMQDNSLINRALLNSTTCFPYMIFFLSCMIE